MGGDDPANYTSLATTPSVVTPVPALGGGGGGWERTHCLLSGSGGVRDGGGGSI